MTHTGVAVYWLRLGKNCDVANSYLSRVFRSIFRSFFQTQLLASQGL